MPRYDATEVGQKIARRLFEQRGDNTEVHLQEQDLALLCKLAFQIGLRAATFSAHEEETVVMLDQSRRKTIIPPPLPTQENSYQGKEPSYEDLQSVCAMDHDQ